MIPTITEHHAMETSRLIKYLRAATGGMEMEYREYRLGVIALCDLSEAMAAKIESLESESLKAFESQLEEGARE
jgi:hypothetical protein